MAQIPSIPPIDPAINFLQHAIEQGDVDAAVIEAKFGGVLGQLDDLIVDIAASIVGLNVATEAINLALDQLGIDIPDNVSIPPDIINLRLSSGSATQLSVLWDIGDESNIAAYLVYLREDGIGEPALRGDIPAPLGPEYSLGFSTLQNLQPSTSYEITVRTRSLTGTLGNPSIVFGTTKAA